MTAHRRVLELFKVWLSDPTMPTTFTYYRGESLARDRKAEPTLGELADVLLLKSDAVFPHVAVCGHHRGDWIGDGTLTLTTWKDRPDNTIYAATKLAVPAPPAIPPATYCNGRLPAPVQAARERLNA